MKTFMRYLLLVLILLLFFSGLVMSVVGSMKEKYCGVIKYKVDATRYSKRSAYADPIFVVKFDFGTREIHPSWDSYMSNKEGDRVCYYMKNHEYGEGLYWYGLLAIVIALIGCLIYCIIMIVGNWK